MIKKVAEKLHIISPPEVRIVELLRKQGVLIGENVHIYDSKIDGTYGKCIRIGNNVTITGAQIIAHDASTKKFIGYTKVGRVFIGNNVFIGVNATILPETFIGDNVIIGAGAVVRGRVDSDSVMIGNPAVRICSCTEYIEKNRKQLSDGYICDGNFTDELISVMETKRVFIL